MLDMGFEQEVRSILSLTSSCMSTLLKAVLSALLLFCYCVYTSVSVALCMRMCARGALSLSLMLLPFLSVD